jgi:hypothetical protein
MTSFVLATIEYAVYYRGSVPVYTRNLQRISQEMYMQAWATRYAR